MDPQIARAKELLASYRPRPELLAKLAQLKLAMLVGPAGSGKDTLRNELLRLHFDSYQKLLSDTSRPMRPGEQEGEEYYFKSAESILKDIQAGEYLQAALPHGRQISGIHHDTLLKLDEAKISVPILVVDTEREVRHLVPHAKTIFLVPPSIDELRKRLYTGRNLSMDEIAKRLDSAEYEIKEALKTPEYYFIVSQTIPQTFAAADAYLRLGQRSEVVNLQARLVAQHILEGMS